MSEQRYLFHFTEQDIAYRATSVLNGGCLRADVVGADRGFFSGSPGARRIASSPAAPLKTVSYSYGRQRQRPSDNGTVAAVRTTGALIRRQ